MKLYWRVKINGKWTFKAADTYELDTGMHTVEVVVPLDGDEDDETEMS